MFFRFLDQIGVNNTTNNYIMLSLICIVEYNPPRQSQISELITISKRTTQLSKMASFKGPIFVSIWCLGINAGAQNISSVHSTILFRGLMHSLFAWLI